MRTRPASPFAAVVLSFLAYGITPTGPALADEAPADDDGAVLARKAAETYARAQAVQDGAPGQGSAESVAAALELARKTFGQAGDLFHDLHLAAATAKARTAALTSAVRAYDRAEKWDRCLQELAEAETTLRGATGATPAETGEIAKGLEEVLAKRAELSVLFFQIPQAVADYRRLYDSNPKGPKAADYLKAAAEIAFANADWDLAIELDTAYVARYRNDSALARRDSVLAAAWRIQQSWQRKGDVVGQTKALQALIARFGSDKLASRRVFQASSLLGQIHETRGDRKNADKVWKVLIGAFKAGGYPKDGGTEATAAAQATFALMKPRYEKFMGTRLQINRTLPEHKRANDLQNQVAAMMDVLLGPEKKVKKPDGSEGSFRGGGMYDEYGQTVSSYRSRDWSYAAYLYRARMLGHFAAILEERPLPDYVNDEEEPDYLAPFVALLEDRAKKSLQFALADAANRGVVNQWVIELRKEATKYQSWEYRLLTEDKRLVTDPPGVLPQPSSILSLPTGPNQADLRSGVEAFGRHQLTDATRRLTAALQESTGPTASMVWYHLALTHARSGDLAAAVAAAQKAVQSDAAHSRAVVLWSVLLFRKGDGRSALEAVDAALARRPTDVMLLGAKAQVLVGLREYQKALDVGILASKLDVSNPEALRYIAEAYAGLGRDGLAQLAFDRALRIYGRGEEEPLKAYPEALGKGQHTPYDERIARSGGSLRGVGAEALDRDAGTARIYELYGRVDMRADRWMEARERFLQATRLRPDDASAWNNLGVCWLVAKKGEEAVDALANSLEIEPTLVQAHVNLGAAYRISKEPDRATKAKAEYERAIQQDPQLAAPYFNLGILYLETELPDVANNEQRFQKAIDYFAAYRKLRGTAPGTDKDPLEDYVAEAVTRLRYARDARRALEQEKAEAEKARQ